MKVNVKIAGASYDGVPSVLIPLQDGGNATFCEVSDTTATADDVATGKTFYAADGTLTTGTKTESTGGEEWELQVTQTANQTITATPKFETVKNNGKYRGEFSPDISVKADSGYIPGTIEKQTDSTNHVVTVTASAAEKISEIEDSEWTKVYVRGTFPYSDEAYSTGISSLSGNVVVAGMKDTDQSSVEYEYPFTRNSGIKKIENNFIEKSGDYYLYNCSSLTSAVLSNLITTGQQVLNNCNALTSVNLHNLITTDYGLLNYCASLTSVDLGSLVTANGSILEGCTDLTNIDLRNLMTLKGSLLRYCVSLTSVDLSSLTTAGDGLLEHCTSLTSVDLGNLTEAGEYFLEECTKIQSCTIHSMTPPTISGDYTKALNDTCVLYVPTGCVDTYKANTALNTLFGGRIQEIAS